MNQDLTTKKYKKNYLTNVIFRIDYPNIGALDSNDLPKDFKESVKTNFPTFQDRMITSYHTKISPQNGIVEKKDQKLWDFINNENSMKVTLASNHLVIEITKYTNFEDFTKCINEVYAAFQKAYSCQPIQRLGLRYINAISMKKGNPLEWEKYIDPDLLGSISWIKQKKHSELCRTISQMFLKDDDSTMTFTYGIPNSEFPAKISRKEFLLDFDCYTEEVEENNLIDKYIKPFHLKINSMFEESIKDDLRTLMGPIT